MRKNNVNLKTDNIKGMVENTENQNISPKTVSNQKKKGNKLFILGLVFFILIFFIGGLAIKAKLLASNTKPIDGNNSSVDVVKEESKEQKGEEVVVEIPQTTDEVVKGPEIVEEIYDYENKLVGIKFNYATDMYIKENTDIVFNTLKSVAETGKNFRIDKDKLSDSLIILQLTTGESDGLLITVSLLPFEITNKSVIANTNIEKEKTAELPLITDDMLKEYDSNVKKTLTELGVTIDVFEQSYVRDVNGLKAIISERKYSGSKETKTGVTDVIQALVPVGENAILVTAITDGSPIEIDKVSLFDEIVDSLIVTLTND